jgi:hypothetical protein
MPSMLSFFEHPDEVLMAPSRLAKQATDTLDRTNIELAWLDGWITIQTAE